MRKNHFYARIQTRRESPGKLQVDLRALVCGSRSGARRETRGKEGGGGGGGASRPKWALCTAAGHFLWAIWSQRRPGARRSRTKLRQTISPNHWGQQQGAHCSTQGRERGKKHRQTDTEEKWEKEREVECGTVGKKKKKTQCGTLKCAGSGGNRLEWPRRVGEDAAGSPGPEEQVWEWGVFPQVKQRVWGEWDGGNKEKKGCESGGQSSASSHLPLFHLCTCWLKSGTGINSQMLHKRWLDLEFLS